MAGDVDLTLDIRGRNTDALRAIAGTKAAMRGIRSEQRQLMRATRDQSRYNRELNQQLDRQRTHLRALTGDYIALRRAMGTLAIRGAVTGFSAIASAATAMGADLVKVSQQAGMFGISVGGVFAAVAQGAVQMNLVTSLALKDIDKALTSSGKDRKKAMDDLTKQGRELVRELEPLRKAYKEIQLLSQMGLAPGLARSARQSRQVIDEFRDAVWNTSQAVGYLAENATDRLVKSQGDLRTALRTNIIAGRRAGDSIIELGDAYLGAYAEAENFIRFTTDESLKWAKAQRKALEEARRDGGLQRFYVDAEKAWKIWTSTLGATGGAVKGVLSASADSSERMARAINDAAKAAEDWTKSERGQKKMREGFEALEPVSGEIAKTLGATASSLITIGIEGSDSATRILRGFRTQVLPLFEEIALHLDEGILESIIDISRETVEFVDTAMPGLQAVSSATAEIVETGAGVLNFLNNMVSRMPAFNQAVAGLALGAGILVGWGKFKLLLENILLRGRQLVGLAPRITPVLAAASSGAAGGMGVIGSAGRTARSSRAGGGGPSFTTVASSGNRGQSHIVFPSPPSMGRGTATQFRNGQPVGGAPLPRSQTLTSGRAPGLYKTGVSAPVFFAGARPLGRIADYDRRLTKGDPLTGGATPGAGTGKNAGRFALVGAAARNSAAGVAQGIKDGTSRGVKEASPILRGGLRLGVAGAVLGGFMGALSSGELKNTIGTRLNRAFSGATFGLIPSQDQKSSDFTDAVSRNLGKGRIQLDARSDEQRALMGQWRTDTLNLAKPEDIKRLKEWASVSAQVNKLSNEQATAIGKAADAQLKYIERARASKQAMSNLKGSFIQESDLNPGVRGLENLESHFRRIRETAAPHMADIKDFTRDAMNSIERSMKRGSESARSATSSAFMRAAAAVKRGMKESTIDAEKGAAKLNQIFRKNLRMYGITGKEADNYLKSPVGDTQGKSHGAGSRSTFAKGTFVGHKGERGADTVPAVINGQNALVARGEYVGVLNGEQQQAFDSMAKAHGYGGLRGFFESHGTQHARTKRFAGGGIVPIPGEPGESIHSSILRDVLKLKRQYKLDITDGYATSGHAADGEHPKGLAIDAIPGAGGSWELIDRLARWAEPIQNQPRAPFRWVGYDGDYNHGKFNHIHLSWAAGATGVSGAGGVAIPEIERAMASGSLPPAMRGLVQGGLDGLTRAARTRLRQALNMGSGEGNETVIPGSTYDGPMNRLFPRHTLNNTAGMAQFTSEQVMALAQSVGLPAQTFDLIAKGESSRYPGIVQIDPGDGNVGWGLWQMTPNAWGEGSLAMNALSRLGGIEQMLNPVKNAKMAKFLYEHAASKIPNTQGFPWYGTAFLGKGGLLRAATGLQPKPPGSGQTAPDVDINDAIPPSSRPDPKDKGKTKPKKKTKPFRAGDYPPGVSGAIGGSKELLRKGKKGKIKGYKLRKKVRQLQKQLKGGKWFDDPDFLDPLTGQAMDAEQMPMFSGVRKLRNQMPGLTQAVANAQASHGLTDEYATVTLEGDDLKNWLGTQGLNDAQVAEWITNYGDTVEVGNPAGITSRGQFMRGLGQYGQEVNSEIQLMSRVRNNWVAQSMIKGANTEGAVKKRRERLQEIKKIFNSNREVIKRTKQKLGKFKNKGYGWKAQIRDNDRIIDALQDHARNSRNLPESYTDRIYDDMDTLRDLNKELREKKPKRQKLGGTHLAKLLSQRNRENTLIAGGTGITDWGSAVSGGGLAGAAANSLEVWRSAGEFKRMVVGESKQGIFDVDTEIGALRKSLDDFKSSMWVPPPEKITGAGGDRTDERDDLLRQIGLDALKDKRTGQYENTALRDFARSLGMRSLGAFAHGTTRVPEDGIAFLHRNEQVVPAPDGPYRSGMTVNRLGGGGGGGDVYLVAEGDLGALFKMMGVRVRQETATVSAAQGRRTRAIRAAAGTR